MHTHTVCYGYLLTGNPNPKTHKPSLLQANYKLDMFCASHFVRFPLDLNLKQGWGWSASPMSFQDGAVFATA